MAKQISGLIGVLLLIGFYMCTFRVYEYQHAILFQLGKIQQSDLEPGLHFKLPFVQNVRTFDSRLQTFDAEPQRFLTGEKKDVIVDSFARWKISDVVQFYKSSDGDPRRAGFLLSQKVNDSLRSEFGTRTVQEVVSGDRGEIMKNVTRIANERGLDLGMEVLDVRLKRIDLPTEVSSNVYERMRSERSRVAREFRARGDKESMTIRADADRQRTVISAEAYKYGQETRGLGDARASEIYAKAYGVNPEFYDFYRSLDAYKSAFNSKKDVLLLNPDTEFFKYFVKPNN